MILASEPGQFLLNSVSKLPGATTNYGTNTIILNVSPAPTAVNVTAANAPESGTGADPINMFTGEYTAEGTWLDAGGPNRLSLSLYYASRSSFSKPAGPLGLNWSHNFETRAAFTSNLATIITWQGQRIRFQQSGANWVLIGDTHVQYQLYSNAGQWLLLDPRSGQQHRGRQRQDDHLRLQFFHRVVDECQR